MHVQRTALFLMTLALTGWSEADEPEKSRPIPGLRLGPRTTVVTEPLNHLGYPDYAKSLNDTQRADVKPEENFWTLADELVDFSDAPEAYLKKLSAIEGFEKAGTRPIAELPRDQAENLGVVLIRPWRVQEFPAIAAWLVESKGGVDVAVRAARRPKAHAPIILLGEKPLLIEAYLPHTAKMRSLVRVLAAQATLSLGEGRIDDAWKNLIACYQISGHQFRGRSVIEGLVGIAVGTMCINGTILAIRAEPPGVDGLHARWRTLAPLIRARPSMERCFLGERFMTIEISLGIRSGECDVLLPSIHDDALDLDAVMPKSVLGLDAKTVVRSLLRRAFNACDINEALEYANRHFDEIASMFQLASYGERVAEWDRIEAEYITNEELPVPSEAIAKSLQGDHSTMVQFSKTFIPRLLAAHYGQVNIAITRLEQRYVLVHAAFVAELHYRKTGRDVREGMQLKELAGPYGFMAGVQCPELKDVFTDEPLRILSEGNLLTIYSVGDDGEDDGGKTFGDGEGCDDLVVRFHRQ